VLISNSRGPSLVPRMASTALMIKLSITCCSCTRSPWMSGKPSTSSVCTETPSFAASPRVISITSRIASFISKRSFRGGAFLMRSRMLPMTSPARWPSLTMQVSASRTSPSSGGRQFRNRSADWALLTVAVIGCFTSWAIEAVSWPIVATRFAYARSICTSRYRRSLSRASASARLRSVKSSTKATPWFPLFSKLATPINTGNTAAIFAEVLLLERLQAPSRLQLWDPSSYVEIEPFRRRQVRPAQATADEIFTIVAKHLKECIVGFRDLAFELPDEDADDVGIEQTSDLRVAFFEFAVQCCQRCQVSLYHIAPLQQESEVKIAIFVRLIIENTNHPKCLAIGPSDRNPEIRNHPQFDIGVAFPRFITESVGDQQRLPAFHHSLAIESRIEIGRFAIAVGNPDAPDIMGRVKSMAIRIVSPDGQEW